MEDDCTAPADDVELCNLVNANTQFENKQVEAVTKLQEIAKKVAEPEPCDVSKALADARQIDKDLENSFKQIRKKGAFAIQAVDSQGEPVGRHDENKLADDIRMHVDDVPISDEKLDFKVEIDRTLTVMKVVLDTPASGWDRLVSGPTAPEDKKRKLSKYILDLAGICHVGLEHDQPTHVKFAKKSLESFRDEFVAREARSVKNRYLRRLGVRCLVVFVAACVGYYFARNSQMQVFHYFRNFWLLVAGSAIGAWLSFALRKVILSFLDLAALEEDNLDPSIRVLFVTGLTIVVGLLFWTEAVTVGIGKFSSGFVSNGTYALLAGLLLGIAERTMATTVFKRASDFAGGVGGK